MHAICTLPALVCMGAVFAWGARAGEGAEGTGKPGGGYIVEGWTAWSVKDWLPSRVRKFLDQTDWDDAKKDRFLNGKIEIGALSEDGRLAFDYHQAFLRGRLPQNAANALEGKDQEEYNKIQEHHKEKGRKVGPAPGQKSSGGFSPIWMIVGVVALMYFLMIRPQKKQRREKEKMISTVVKGAAVITIGGIKGTVVRVTDNEALLLIDREKKIHMTVIKSSIHHVLGAGEGQQTEAAGEGGAEEIRNAEQT